jgi:hypothetical protein
MKSNILLIYFTMGPTFRQRSVDTIIKNKGSYDLFDILLMTDYKNDPAYDVLKSYDNITIVEIDELRKEYQWSIDFEKLPIKTLSDQEYATDIIENDIKIPSSIWRFALAHPGIEKYDALMFLNCDVQCVATEDAIMPVIKLFSECETDTVIGHGLYNYTDQFRQTADQLSMDFGLNKITRDLLSTDGNFFSYVFKNKTNIKKYLEIMNRIIYEILVEKKDHLFFLGQHSTWLTHNEAIQSIVNASLDMDIHPHPGYIYHNFELKRYPEDRFWNGSSDIFICTLEGKSHFIKTNYNELKAYYEQYSQVWNY